MKKLNILKQLFFVYIFASTTALFAITQTEAIQMVEANPALLNTPQAQIELSKRGLSTTEVLDRLKNANTFNESTPSIELLNSIVSIEMNATDMNSSDMNTSDEINELARNPILYKDNKTRLKDIRAYQSKPISEDILKRFSKTFFANHNTVKNSLLPVPSYYIVNKNDTISIWIYGGTNKNIKAVVDNNGNINIDTLGPIQVAGLEFSKVNEILKSQLSSAFAGANVVVNITNYSTIQVTLAGYVNGMGVYNVPSLSTVKDLLIESGGVRSNGTVRNILIHRDGKMLKAIDFYELLYGQNERVNTLLRNGDTVVIGRASKIVEIDGSVENPGLYELKANEKLDSLIKYAGGLMPTASKSGIKIEGFNNHEKRVTRMVNLSDSKEKTLNNRDKVYIFGIDKAHQESIYLYGNVVRPGSRSMESSLFEFFKKEVDALGLKGVFLENTLFTYAMIKSKNADLTTSVSRFNLAKVLDGKEDKQLKVDDEIYIFNKLDSELNPYVIIDGSVVTKTGEYQYYDGLTVWDLIQIAGTKGPYDKSKIKVVTYNTKDHMPSIKFITLRESARYRLSPYAEIELYDYYELNKIAVATISGEVNIPDEYHINSRDTTLDQLIDVAGGLTQKAYTKSCEIIRYHVVNDERVKDLINIPLSKASQFKVQNFDEIRIKKIPNWGETKTITLKGEVNFPGEYVFEYGDKLADVIRRAGGFTQEAFLYGAVFSRESVSVLQKKKLKESIAKLKEKAAVMENSPATTGTTTTKGLSQTVQMIEKLSKESEELEPLGRVTINLEKDIEMFAKTSSNLTLQDKDTLYIPTLDDTVLVTGQVMNPTAIIYDDDDDVATYLAKAGGLTQLADDDNIIVIHANGDAQRYSEGLFFNGRVNVGKGSVIVVSQKLVTETGMQVAKDISSILYQFAITAASLKTVGGI